MNTENNALPYEVLAAIRAKKEEGHGKKAIVAAAVRAALGDQVEETKGAMRALAKATSWAEANVILPALGLAGEILRNPAGMGIHLPSSITTGGGNWGLPNIVAVADMVAETKYRRGQEPGASTGPED